MALRKSPLGHPSFPSQSLGTRDQELKRPLRMPCSRRLDRLAQWKAPRRTLSDQPSTAPMQRASPASGQDRRESYPGTQLVVLISPKLSIDRRHMSPDICVVKPDNFAAWWEQETGKIGVGQAFGVASRHLVGGYSKEGFVSLCQALLGAHVPARYDWRSRLNLTADKPLNTPKLLSCNCAAGYERDTRRSADSAGKISSAGSRTAVTRYETKSVLNLSKL